MEQYVQGYWELCVQLYVVCGCKYRSLTLPNVSLDPLDIPDGPFHTMRMDLLKFYTSSRGFNYILVIIDSFSQFVIANAIRSETAKP